MRVSEELEISTISLDREIAGWRNENEGSLRQLNAPIGDPLELVVLEEHVAQKLIGCLVSVEAIDQVVRIRPPVVPQPQRD